MRLPCGVIEDLLPLYHDSVCSEESRNLVEEHLAECNSCSSLLEEMNNDVSVALNNDNLAPLRRINTEWNRTKKKNFLKGAATIACICLVLLGGYFGLTQWTIVSVPTKIIEVTEICQLSDGNISFHLYINDDKNLQTILYNITEDGIMYITPKRAVIEEKRNNALNWGLYNSTYNVNINPNDHGDNTKFFDFSFTKENAKAIYIGTEKDGILVWEAGDKLPAASQDTEKVYLSGKQQ